MKMKKLLSMGAIGLVLACSTSIGASAATIPTELMTKDYLTKMITNQYKNGTNTFEVLSGVNKDTTIGDLVKINVTTQGAAGFSVDPSSHPMANKILTKVVNNKDNTIAIVLDKATKDGDAFKKFKGNFATVVNKIQEMDKLEGTERKNAEEKVIVIIKLYDSRLDVTFGKDSQGKTTGSMKKDGQVLIQLNSDNFKTLSELVNNLSLEDVTNAMK